MLISHDDMVPNAIVTCRLFNPKSVHEPFGMKLDPDDQEALVNLLTGIF